jgi:hypothetical protein
MNSDEKQLLTTLFERVRTASTAPRDAEAEAMIAAAVREQPYAPYLLAQTVLLQEQALKAADARLHELESKITSLEQAKAEPAPSFLGSIGTSLFGSGKTASGVPSVGVAPPSQPQPTPGVWGQPRQTQQPNFAPQPNYAPQPGYAPQQGFGGGSFLQSAMTTAAGVAGGALLYQGISSLFHSGGGYGGGFGGGGMNAGFGGAPVVNETIYETVNNYGSTESAPSHVTHSEPSGSAPDAGYQEASYDDTAFDSGSDDSGFA